MRSIWRHTGYRFFKNRTRIDAGIFIGSLAWSRGHEWIETYGEENPGSFGYENNSLITRSPGESSGMTSGSRVRGEKKKRKKK
jgi:hypothetical protein